MKLFVSMVCGIIMGAVIAASCFAGAVTLPWSSSLNCAAWTYDGSYNVTPPAGCSEFMLESSGSACGTYSAMLPAANRSGSSGNGIRQLVGAGVNIQTTGFDIDFGSQSSVWIRWYQRYQSGFTWATLNYHKDIYLVDSTASRQYIIAEPYGSTYRVAWWDGTTSDAVYGNGTGWSTIGDGNWHLYELHVTQSGTIQMWIDEKQIINGSTGKSFPYGWGFILFGSNASQPSSNCKAIDYDDLAISSTGYIGPVGGSGGGGGGVPADTTPPVVSNGSPSGTQSCTSDPRSVSISVSTNEAATCKFAGTDLAYASMPYTFSTTGSTSHLTTVNDACGAAYTYYVRCQDAAGNASTAGTPISFSLAPAAGGGGTQPILSESFEDLNWSSRSWYDNAAHGLLETAGCYSGNCLKWAWAQSGTTPTNGAAVRKLFTPSEEVFLRYYLKVDSNWQGSGLSYQPHMLQFLSDRDDNYQGPASAYLDTYFEINGNPPNAIFVVQDSQLINTTLGAPPINLTGVTENRALGGCNGVLGDPGTSESCYQSGSWFNGRTWKDSTTTLSKNTWHKLEFYLKMNTISNNIAQANGILQLWVDGKLTVSKTNMAYRTNQQATKKWKQLLLGPYMGSGSPIAQTMWLDELSIYNSNQGGSNTPPAIPTGLTIGP